MTARHTGCRLEPMWSRARTRLLNEHTTQLLRPLLTLANQVGLSPWIGLQLALRLKQCGDPGSEGHAKAGAVHHPRSRLERLVTKDFPPASDKKGIEL